VKVRRTAVTDSFVFEDESVVLVDHLVVHLSEIPTAILKMAAEWTELTDVADILVNRFGSAPHDHLAATQRVVQELQNQGLVECD
jgi:hypothetical protein